MKKTLIVLAVSCILFACTKPRMTPSMPGRFSITGKWKIEAVNTYAYDSAGLRDSARYPIAGGYQFTFQFDADNSWTESIASSSYDSVLVASNGSYTITSDTTFTLIYPNASPARMNELCNILALNDTLFIFTKQVATVFNGTDSGYTRYVFTLAK